ncbi:terminase [Nocardiopsis dassonvillei]|uniref:terminase n=1 Tax=Nocardiopsis dassonvillei TaxID=2014 RepID=UPI00157C8BB4|nr:terminase [Nocardiopsis dassonvillei]
MTTAPSTDELELPPGYYLDPATGAWLTLPWPGDCTLPWGHPSRLELLPPSLGPAIIRWAESTLVHPLTGAPWRYTPGQKRFLHLWYAVREDGRWLYRSGVKRGAKGVGKDPFGGSMALAEFVGPVEFVGWDERGRPTSRPRKMSLVQIAANSESQAKDMLRVANAMISKKMRLKYGITPGKLQTQTSSGSLIELLVNSERSSEGDPPTAVFLNESHHMTEASGGHALAAVARRNVGKSPTYIGARLLELTNAHQQGMDSVAENSYEAWQAQAAGKTALTDILYDSVEADPSTDLYDVESLERGIRQAYMDAPWIDVERLIAEVQDLRTSVADSIRFYLNGLAAAEDAWVDPRRFDALARPEIVVDDRERITLFLDCSKSTDATGLVGCRISDGHIFTLGMWQRPHGERGKGWLAPRHEVEATARAALERYKVMWFGIDPSPARDDEDESLYWKEMIDGLHRDWHKRLFLWATPGAQLGHSVMFDMRMSARGARERNQRFTEEAMEVARLVDEEDGVPFTWDGHAGLRMHAHNAKRRPNQFGFTLGKVTRDSSKLVDLAVCAVGARLGRRLVMNHPKFRKGAKTRKGKAVVLR